MKGTWKRFAKHGRQFNDGHYQLFKSSMKSDGDLGRQQHNFQPRRSFRLKAHRQAQEAPNCWPWRSRPAQAMNPAMTNTVIAVNAMAVA